MKKLIKLDSSDPKSEEWIGKKCLFSDFEVGSDATRAGILKDIDLSNEIIWLEEKIEPHHFIYSSSNQFFKKHPLDGEGFENCWGIIND